MLILIISGIGGYRYWNQFFSSFLVFSLTDAELLFFEQGITAQELIESKRCEIAVNGSYFGKDERGLFFPAGIWLSDTSYKNTPSTDLNLQNTIRWDQNVWKAEFFFDQPSSEAFSWAVVFNAGPRLLKNGGINSDLDRWISHRKREVPRTVILKDKHGQPFLFVFKKGISLIDLAKLLQDQGFVDAINLDGGPSTSFAHQGIFKRNFNINERLPIFFCIS